MSGSLGKVKVWKRDSGECVWTFDGHNSWVQSVKFSFCGKFVASGSQDNTIRVWELEEEGKVQVLEGHRDWV